MKDDLTPTAPVGIEVFSANPSTGNYEGRVIFNTTDNQLKRYTSGAYIQVAEPTTYAGTVGDGTITAAKLAAGLTPIEFGSSLPSSGNFAGRMYFLTSDNKLYRHTGSAWISTTAAADVTGTIGTSQIAAGAVTANEIAANTITSGKIAAGAITTVALAAGAVNASKITAGTITATEIAANTITAGKIQAGAIGTTELAANAVTAAKIAANTITAAQIQAGTIVASTIASGTITAALIQAGAITSTQLSSDSVIAGKIAAGAVGASQINVSSLSAISANIGAITAGTITGVVITGATVQTASSGIRSVMDGARSMIRTEDPSYTSRTYYRNLGLSEQNIIANMGGDGGTGYIRSINYLAGHGIDGIGLGSSGSPDSTPNAQGVTGYGDFSGLTGTGTKNGVIGVGGTYDFYAAGAGTNYAPFTGSHDGIVAKAVGGINGDIFVDVSVIARRSVSNAIFEVALSSTLNQAGALGVLSARGTIWDTGAPIAISDGTGPLATLGASYTAYKTTKDRVSINGVGEGLINVVGENGDIAVGDLIVCSSTAGKGTKQADNIVRSHTVAKAREARTFATAGTEHQIACIYLCG